MRPPAGVRRSRGGLPLDQVGVVGRRLFLTPRPACDGPEVEHRAGNLLKEPHRIILGQIEIDHRPGACDVGLGALGGHDDLEARPRAA